MIVSSASDVFIRITIGCGTLRSKAMSFLLEDKEIAKGVNESNKRKNKMRLKKKETRKERRKWKVKR